VQVVGHPRVEQTPHGQVRADLRFFTQFLHSVAGLCLQLMSPFLWVMQIITFPLRLSVNQKGIMVEQLIERRKVRAPAPHEI
jgi:hypothetical protein